MIRREYSRQMVEQTAMAGIAYPTFWYDQDDQDRKVSFNDILSFVEFGFYIQFGEPHA